MNKWHRIVAAGLTASAACGIASAAVTLTTGSVTWTGRVGAATTPTPPENVPLVYLENQWIKVAIISGPVTGTYSDANGAAASPDYTGVGEVFTLTKKQGTQTDGTSQLSFRDNAGDFGTAPNARPSLGITDNKSFLAYRDRIAANDDSVVTGPVPAGPYTSNAVVSVTSTNVDPGGAFGEVTVTSTSFAGRAGVSLVKTYHLDNNAKWLHTSYAWTNSGDNYSQPGGSSIESIIYSTPGGSSGTNTNDVQYGKTVNGLSATTTNLWYGRGGTPLAGELIEPWLAVVDPINDVALATTWDKDTQTAAAAQVPNVVRGGFFSNRYTFEVFYEDLAAGATLNYYNNLIVDDGIPDVSYAKEGQLLAGISMSAATYSIEGSATASFHLNSLDPTAAHTYSIRNLHVEQTNGTTLNTIAIADINNVSVAANGHVTTPARQFVLKDPSLIAGQSYYVKGDLYDPSNSVTITTLSSRPFLVDQADVKVSLYQDAATGNYILENEVYSFNIDATSSHFSHILTMALKNASNRNQTVTSTPSYPMFQDHIQPDNTQSDFQDWTYTLNPNGTDSPTEKSISFSGDSFEGNLTKTYTLDSNSRSLKVNLKYDNLYDPMNGGGFFSDVPMDPGGTAGSNDAFTAHAGGTQVVINPPANPALVRYYFGARDKSDNSGTAMLGDQPEMDQGWMAVTDRTVTDALAISWDLNYQHQFSLTPDGATSPITMNSLVIGDNYTRQVAQVHYTNIPVGASVNATEYLMGDTGFGLIGYAEANRVMAGVWADLTDVQQAHALTFHAGITNTGTTSRTYDLKNIRIVKSTGESTAAGADITGIVLAAAAHSNQDLTFTIPSAEIVGTYTVLADLYEGGTLVSTLKSLTFTISPGTAAPTGDVNGDSVVNSQDTIAALRIAGGLTTATSDQVARGNLNADAGITLLDALAIQRKVSGL